MQEEKWEFFVHYGKLPYRMDEYEREFLIGWRKLPPENGQMYLMKGLKLQFRLPFIISINF